MDDESQKALMKKACLFLGRRAYSRGELRIKLSGLAGESQVESALDRLEQLKLLNDADYAYNFALSRIRGKGWGPAKVRESLIRRHLSQASIDRAMQQIQKEPEDESALARYIEKYCGKKGAPTQPENLHKLILHLCRRGYDRESIVQALKRIVPAAAMQHFETGE